MTRVVLSPKAQSDSDHILSSLVRIAGPSVAGRYASDFDRLYATIGAFPDLHAARPHLGLDIRVAIVSPYLVFFRRDAASGTVRVLRIVHGRRRITRRLVRG